MPPVTKARVAPPRPRSPTAAPIAGQQRRALVPGRQAAGPFSAIVLADPNSAIAGVLYASLTEVGASEVRYATSPADLLRAIPHPIETGVGVICRSPHGEVMSQLITQLRLRGWRRLVIACEDGDEAAIRLAIAGKVRCLIRRPGMGSDQQTARARQPLGGMRDLSHREIEVLQLVANGHTNNEIGRSLGLSGLTVKSHLARIGRKTGSGDRAQMVAIAMRAGLVT